MADTKYKLAAINTKAGRFVVHLINKENPPANAACGGPVESCYSHDMTIADQAGKTLAASATVKPGADDVFVIDNLPSGSYQFYCSIKDHQSRGMKGTITVT